MNHDTADNGWSEPRCMYCDEPVSLEPGVVHYCGAVGRTITKPAYRVTKPIAKMSAEEWSALMGRPPGLGADPGLDAVQGVPAAAHQCKTCGGVALPFIDERARFAERRVRSWRTACIVIFVAMTIALAAQTYVVHTL